MNVLSKILVFIFCLSVINILKHGWRILMEVRKEEPQKIQYSTQELWLIGGSVSYIITVLLTGIE